jgi:hypothetical protein
MHPNGKTLITAQSSMSEITWATNRFVRLGNSATIADQIDFTNDDCMANEPYVA